MANPQLTSYIKQQLGLGDNEASIKNNLRSVGWAENDVADAFKEVSPSPAAATPVVQPVQKPAATPSFTPQTTQPMANPSPAMPNLSASPAPKVAAPESRKINLENFAPMSSPSPMVRPFSASPAVVSFTAQKPMENIFQPKSMGAVPGMNPGPAATPMASMAPMVAAPKKSWGALIGMIFMGLIIAGLGGLSWLLYQNNSGLKAQVDNVMVQLNSIAGQQTANSQNLASQIAALQDQNQDLDSQLGLFLARSATSTATTTLKGVLSGGGKLSYTLATSKGVVVSVKNSKDPKIVAALAPLLGLPTVLTGIPTAGAREITVTAINGIVPAEPVTATSTATTTPNPTPPVTP